MVLAPPALVGSIPAVAGSLPNPPSTNGDWIPLALSIAGIAALFVWTLRRHSAATRQAGELAARAEREAEARRLAEAGLHESREQFRGFFESSPDAVFVLSLDGRVLDANSAARRLHGVAEGQSVGKTFADLLPAGLQEDAAGELLRLKESPNGPVESFHSGPENLVVPVETRVSRIPYRGEPALLLHVRDVTESQRTKAALRDVEERHREVLEGLAEGVMLVAEDGSVQAANQSACRILGHSIETILASNVLRGDWVAVSEDSKPLAPGDYPIVQALRTGNSSNRFVLGIPKPGGTTIWLSVNARPVRRSPNGAVLAAVASFHDITDERRIRNELVMARDAAENANRAKSEFLAHVSHEIRTPMGGIVGMHDILLATPLTDEQRGHVHAASQSTNDLLQIINDLLDLSKIEAGKFELAPEPFSLLELVRNTLGLFVPRASSNGVAIHCRLAPDIPDLVRADAQRLRQILSNLLNNAVKFTPAGSITVEVRRDPDSPPEDAMLWFTVSDTGIGISRDKLDLIFEAFTQADISIGRRFGGTGLGLSICRQLVGLMSGRIWVESETGHGSRFHFVVRIEPVASGEPRDGQSPRDAMDVATPSNAGTNAAAPGTDARQRTGHVLIVEDHPVNRQLTEAMVSKLGLTTALAATGREALALLEGTPFDLVLMDVQMPELDGLTATRRWREREAELGRKRVPIVAVTAHALPQDREACREAGMDAYLSKPLRREALEAAIAGQLAQTPVPAPAPAPREDPRKSTREPGRLNPNLLEMLRTTSLEAIERVRVALAHANQEEAAKAIHFLKGGCALLQDSAVTKHLQALDEHAKAGRIGNIAGELPQIEVAIAATIARQLEALSPPQPAAPNVPAP